MLTTSQISPKIDLSVIVAVYNEDPRNLMSVVERLDAIIKPTAVNYELVFVNDGSRPPTTNALRQIAAEFEHVKLVELSRNFGQQAAITCGLDHSEGLAVVNIDSDLQDPPELIPEMMQKWKEGYDVVYAQRSTRRDRFSKQFSAYLFYRFLGAISSVDIPQDTGDYRLMDRRVVDALASLPEKTRFLRGMIPWLGFKQCGIAIDRGAREVGESTYTLKKLVTLALDGILAFSIAPLYFISVVGAVIMGLSAVALVFALVMGGMVSGVVSSLVQTQVLIVSAVGLFCGVQVFCTGVVAAYLAKVLDESRARPTYLVGNKLGQGFMRNAKSQELTRSAQSMEVAYEKSELGAIP
jgi:glycosyltransferase involved in cell wall biosynthesis